MKMFLVHNVVFFPIMDLYTGEGISQKYVSGSISGDINLNSIYTEEEIRTKYNDPRHNLTEVKTLHEIIEKWGPRTIFSKK